ncbi:MAG: hypothetical protein FJX28_13630 [Alphaproteobacteria bacterium]|jgi:hypothetical protein|nr:hypothetical protein [Alphaproteobacteria bacterium]
MLFKIILVFLLGMALVGMIGKALFPGKMSRITQIRRRGLKPPVCSRCGRYIVGKSDCECKKA